MSASYWLRLLSLSLASFFLVHAAATLILWIVKGRFIRSAERMRSTTAARFMFAMRALPFGIALLSVAALCAPSYLRFETDSLPEPIGLACLALAAAGFLICVAAIDKGLRSATSSIEFARQCQGAGHSVRLRGVPSQMLVIPGPRAFLAQVGIFRPRIVISQPLLKEFSADELSAALGHERAHWIARDNLKRLLFAFLPDLLPFFPALRAFEQSWARFAERAADDHIRVGTPERAVSLASALVRLARVGAGGNSDSCDHLATSALGGADDLGGRVNRLLTLDRLGAPQFHLLSFVGGAVFLLVTCCLITAAWPAALSPVHEFLEFLIR